MTTIVLGLRALLAVVFIAAGVGKLLDLDGSRRAVRNFGVPEYAARVVGLLLPLAELAIGLALIFRPSARWAALGALVLLAAFIVAIARAVARGEEPDCHCFGQIHSAPAGRATLARNAVLAACAVVVVAYGSGPAVDTWLNARSAAELVAVGAVIAAVAAAVYALSLRSEVKQLKRDLEIAGKAAASGLAGLTIGTDAPPFTLPSLQGGAVTLNGLLERNQPALLAFMSPSCGPCEKFLPKLRMWQESLSASLTIAVISTGTKKQNALFNEYGVEDVLLQEEMEVADQYRISGTPSAIVVSRHGKIASNVGQMEQGIEPLVRLALRDVVGAPALGPAA
jgi:uncharacterized membrane protein YphA (DoxX/SURF4 family)/thiol-disulfide isomerase/thioredoxin